MEKLLDNTLTCPPTTATEGRASQRVGRAPSAPPWSPRTVQARWILLTRPIKLSMVVIAETLTLEFEARKRRRRIEKRRTKEKAWVRNEKIAVGSELSVLGISPN